jgi:hypothetical protein
MRSLFRRYQNGLGLIVIAIAIATASVALDNRRAMSAVWYGPYLSAAENVSWGGQFLMNLDEVIAFREMSEAEREAYRFKEHENLQAYIANPLGFAYVIAAAKNLFPWLPDIPAIEALQITLHVLLSLMVIAMLDGRLSKALFLVLYSLNPIVLYYVTFPYYYFYQAIPSFALIFLMLGHRKWASELSRFHSVVFLLLCSMLALVLLMRSTTILAIVAFFTLALIWFPARKTFAAGLTVFVFLFVTGHSPSEKNFWHTAYVGVGAYPNAHVEGLSDDNGYALFERLTGAPLDASLGGNYYHSATMAEYRDITRDEFMRILNEDWLALVRNAALNGLQGFTIGYPVGQPYWVHLRMARPELSFWPRLEHDPAVVASSADCANRGAFTPYYPPIPVYMYGTYALLVLRRDRGGRKSTGDTQRTEVVGALSTRLAAKSSTPPTRYICTSFDHDVYRWVRRYIAGGGTRIGAGDHVRKRN